MIIQVFSALRSKLSTAIFLLVQYLTHLPLLYQCRRETLSFLSSYSDVEIWEHTWLKAKQESPPAWTQEAYRPPHSHSKSLLFGGGGGPSTKNFFPSLNMYQAKSGVKNFSLYWDPVPPLDLRLGSPPWTWTWDSPPPQPGPGTPPDLDPPTSTWTWNPPPPWPWPRTPRDLDPPTSAWTCDLPPPHFNLGPGTPPPRVNRQTFPSINITFPRTTYAGGKYFLMNLSQIYIC